MKKANGRPPVPGEKRIKLVAFYLTESDQESLKKTAAEGGFKSMSSVVTIMMESLIHGGFSLKSAAFGLSLVRGQMQKNGVKFTASPKEMAQAVFDLFVPPPPLISDDEIDLSQLKHDLRSLLDELETQTNNTSKK